MQGNKCNQATDESQIVYSSDENETFNDILEGVSDKVASSIQLNSKYVTSSPKSNSNENIDFNVLLSTASSNEKLRSLTPKMNFTLALNDSGMEVERSLEVVNSEDEQGEGESEQQEEKEHGNAAKHPEKSLQIVNSKDDQCGDKIVVCANAVNNATCDTKREDESNQQGEKGHGNAAAKRQNKKPALFNTSTQSIMDLTLPLNDSGMEVERSLEIVDSEDEQGEGESNKKHPDKKPERPCVFCKIPQTRLKRHILTKHKDHKEVAPLLTLTSKEQDIIIAEFRRDGIRSHNMEILKSGDKSFIRERKSSYEDLPVMCAGCKDFFAKSYKARHQLVCPSNGTNFMIPAISIDSSCILESYSDNFKALLNTLQLDDVGSYIQTDGIILMVGARSFAGVRRKKDKQNEANKSVRGRMRLLTRVYLAFRDLYSKQTEIILQETKGDASDMFRRETITILGNAVVGMCEKSETNTVEESNSVTDLKSGLMISIEFVKTFSKISDWPFPCKRCRQRFQKGC